jgi:hypothetical protein
MGSERRRCKNARRMDSGRRRMESRRATYYPRQVVEISGNLDCERDSGGNEVWSSYGRTRCELKGLSHLSYGAARIMSYLASAEVKNLHVMSVNY